MKHLVYFDFNDFEDEQMYDLTVGHLKHHYRATDLDIESVEEGKNHVIMVKKKNAKVKRYALKAILHL